MDQPDHVRGARLTGDWPAGWSVHHVVETGSTNADLLEASAAGAPDRTVLVTDHQTEGRGRLDRRWDAPPGANLLVSILFRDVPERPSDLTHLVGVAAVDAVREVSGSGSAGEASLKWPNDVMLGDRKLAGILAQRAPDGPVVVGLGLNVGWAPDGAAHLGADVRPHGVLAAMLRHLDTPPVDLHERYRAVLSTLGRQVRVELPDGEIVGTAVDVGVDGRLEVLDECAITHRLDVGDVVHLRPT